MTCMRDAWQSHGADNHKQSLDEQQHYTSQYSFYYWALKIYVHLSELKKYNLSSFIVFCYYLVFDGHKLCTKRCIVWYTDDDDLVLMQQNAKRIYDAYNLSFELSWCQFIRNVSLPSFDFDTRKDMYINEPAILRFNSITAFVYFNINHTFNYCFMCNFLSVTLKLYISMRLSW